MARPPTLAEQAEAALGVFRDLQIADRENSIAKASALAQISIAKSLEELVEAIKSMALY